MANFCTKCGSALAEGQICACSMPGPQPGVNMQPQVQPRPGVNMQPGVPAYNPMQGQPQGQAYSAQASYLTNLFSFFFDAIKKPATTVKSLYQKRDQGLAWGLISIFAIAFTVSMFTMMSAIIGVFMRSLPFGGAFLSPYGGDLVPYAKIFFTSIIMSGAFTVLMAVASLIYVKVFNKNFDFVQGLCFAGFVTIPMSVTLLVGSLLIFVLEGFAFILFAMGILLSVIFTFIGFKYAHNWDDDKLVYMLASYCVTYMIFCVFLMYMMARILL